MPPSPTAAAQRFTEPERTSPAAKMPGRLVSSGAGERLLSFQAGAPATSDPVLMKPFSSRSISDGSHSVHGRAPIMEKIADVRTTRLSRLHPSCKITRHVFEKIVAADYEQHFGRAVGKEHRGLARGIAATGDDDGFAAANLTFQRSRSVVNAYTLKLFATLRIESPVIRAR